MSNDRDLLQAYVRDRSDAAFRELVRRHTVLVFSCARQQLGDPQAAEDVTQSVFIALAIKAPQLPAATILAGWLYRATRFAAADYRRREQHRREREMKAHEQHQIHQSATDSAAVWQEIQPHLHAALDDLSAADRAAVLLRFYQQSSYRDMAQTLAITEEAAKKRVGRAEERLRRFFGRRGIGLTAGVLVTALGTRAVEATPATLAAQAAQTALGTLAGTMASTSTLMIAKGALHAMFIAKVKTVSLAAAACLVVAGSGVVAAKQLSWSIPDTSPPEPIQVAAKQMAAPAPGAPALPAPPADKDAAKTLTATIKAEKAEFRTDERLRFTVTFANQSKEDVILPVQDSLGSRTAGQYTPSIRNVTTGEKWLFGLLPSRAPVRLTQEVLKAGATLDLAYSLPGTFAKADGTPVPHLPAGKYELACRNSMRMSPS